MEDFPDSKCFVEQGLGAPVATEAGFVPVQVLKMENNMSLINIKTVLCSTGRKYIRICLLECIDFVNFVVRVHSFRRFLKTRAIWNTSGV